MREYIDLLDTFRARTFLGDSETLPPRYTVIGEPMSRVSVDTPGWMPAVNMFSPLRITRASKDPVYLEMSRLSRHFQPVNSNRGGVDWAEYTDNTVEYEHDAWSYWQKRQGEIKLFVTVPDPQAQLEGEHFEGGYTYTEMTLREALENLMVPGAPGHVRWQQLVAKPPRSDANPGVTPAYSAVNQLMNKFREAAAKDTMDVFPQLFRDLQEFKAVDNENQAMEIEAMDADAAGLLREMAETRRGATNQQDLNSALEAMGGGM
jgi:hypothetical protein